jgi:hypothetical protein
MRKIMLLFMFIALMTTTPQAAKYQVNADPWILEFDSTQIVSDIAFYTEPDESGASFWSVTLMDDLDHEVAWFAIFSYSTRKKATDAAFDNMLDVYIQSFQVTSPTKTSVAIDGTRGRQGEGYSSTFSRTWRGIVYAYQPIFDSFTNTNTTKEFIYFGSIQDFAGFEEVANSLQVTSASEP